MLFRDHDVDVDYSFRYTPEGHVDSMTLSRMPQKQGQTFAPDTDWGEQSRDWLHLNAATQRKKRLDAFLQSYSLPLTLNCACDQVGTLRLLTDPSGRVVKSISRDSFGNLIEDSFADMFIPVGFAGGLEDKYIGFTRFGWRDYDPVAGRFMSVDPAKDLRGDADLYDYCADDPVNKIDPTGLWTQETFDESRVSRDRQGQFSSGIGVNGSIITVNAEPRVSVGSMGGSPAANLVEELKVQSSTLKADLQQRLAGKDGNVYKDTLEKLQAQTPDNATIEERERAIEIAMFCINAIPATEWIRSSMWETMPEYLANEVGEYAFDGKMEDIVIGKAAQFVISMIAKKVKLRIPIVGDLGKR